MGFIQPTLVVVLLLFLGTGTTLAADPNPVTTALMSLVNWQRNFIPEIGRFLVLIRDDTSLIVLTSSTGLAFLYGALSELSSGHSKLVAAAYFLGGPKKIIQSFLVCCQVSLVNVAATAILAGTGDIILRRIFDGTPPHSVWLRLATFAAITAIGFFLALYTIRTRWTTTETAPTNTKQNARLETYSLLGLIVAMGVIPKAGTVPLLVFASTNEIYSTGLLLACAVSTGMALTIFFFSAVGIGAHHVALVFADEKASSEQHITAFLRLVSALTILALAFTYSVLTLMEIYC